MSTGLSISDGRVGIVHYTLTNSDGEIIDSSLGRDPMPYLHGAQNIIPGLEKALEGKVGNRISLDLKTDPAIIGGLVVRVGSRMVDSSLRTKLQRLQLAMKGVG